MAWQLKVLGIAAAGTAIEYFDYSLFTVFLPVLAPVFFPKPSLSESLAIGYWVLSVSMWIRPLSGLFFGWIGDTWGRRPALLLSVTGITVMTGLLAILPGADQIGIWALVAMIAIKLLQVFCFAGEYVGAGVYTMEHAPPHQQGIASAALSAITSLGSLGAAALGVVLSHWEFDGMAIFRISCGVGCVMGLLLLWARRHFEESPEFLKAHASVHPTRFPHAAAPAPAVQAASRFVAMYWRELGAGFCLGGMATVPFSTVFAFINPLLVTRGILTPDDLWAFQAGIGVLAVGMLLLAGWLSDRSRPEKIMGLGNLVLALSVYPVLVAVDQAVQTPSRWLAFGALGFFLMGAEWILGLTHVYLRRLFPVQVRYRGVALGFGTGLSVIGGITLLVEHALFQRGGTFTSLAGWLLALNGALAWTMWLVHKKGAHRAPHVT